MARREVTHYFDDLNNAPLNDNEVNTVRFGFEGTEYFLDLSDDNAQEFRGLLEPYVNVARKVTATRSPKRESVSTRSNSRAIRAWAQGQGIKIAARGKIPHEVIEDHTTPQELTKHY